MKKERTNERTNERKKETFTRPNHSKRNDGFIIGLQ